MNLFFYLLVLLFAILLWFLLSGIFIPLGELIYKMWKKATDITNIEKDQEDQEEKK